MLRRLRWLAAALSLIVALTSCTSVPAGRSLASSVCPRLCLGRVDGAAYAIRVPMNWNGTLLLYSHGYTTVRPVAHMTQTDSTGTGADAVSQALLARGYALAGSAYGTDTGWTVAEALRADVGLYARFVDLIGKPVRVYAWGSSMGGLITEVLAERYAWIDGAAPLCGLVGGPLPNVDNYAESVAATQTLLGVDLTAGWARTSGGGRASGRLADALATADRDPGGDEASRVLFLATLIGLPVRDAAKPTSRTAVRTAAASLQRYDSFAVTAFADFERRFGGNPASGGSRTVLRRSTLAAADRAVVARGGDPALFRAALGRTPPLTADAAARTALQHTGDPTGALRVPTLTMHTVYDPLVLVANESLLRERAAASGAGDLLDQVFIAPPHGTGPASYGVGHCRFDARQQVGVITALDGWVRSGQRPTAGTLRGDIGPGWDRDFHPPAWPSDDR